jgi:nitrogen fixation NifU-like protein
MSDLSDLYQELILDHSKQPHNRREIPEPDRKADGHNPLCGDRIRVFVKMDGDRVADCSFLSVSCAICTASASLMTDAVKGVSQDKANELFKRFHTMMTESDDPETADLGKLAVLSGVRNYPVRVKCATLPWHTLKAALSEPEKVASTE